MFGKRKQSGGQGDAKPRDAKSGDAKPGIGGPAGRGEPDLTAARAKAPAAAPAEPLRRQPERIVAPARRNESEAAPARPEAPAPAGEGRRLVVGRDIRLSGEIKKCDKLVVEGQVEASLTESRALEISETGLFSGDAVVEEAEVSGCFEGELTVNGRLHIRASGQVVGTVRYADIEIERGGRIAGSIDVMLPDPAEDLTRPLAGTPASSVTPAGAADSAKAAAGEDADAEAASGKGNAANGADETLSLTQPGQPNA